MKPKWIKRTISRKVHDWLSSISDSRVKSLVEGNVVVTGGSIVSLLLGEQVNDYDIYFRTQEAAEAVALYYVEQFEKNPPPSFKDGTGVKIAVSTEDGRVKIVVKSAGIAGESGDRDYEYFEQYPEGDEGAEYVAEVAESLSESSAEDGEKKPKYRPIFLSTNAITLSDKVQLVLRFTGSPHEIHSTYDFVHCTCYWDDQDKNLVTPNNALLSILSKDLKYMGQSKYPICAMIRLRKFISRGWRITAGQMLKIAWDIGALDLNDIDVLEDQLTGVDTAYFNQVIEMLRSRKGEGVDSAYLMQVIDEIF